MKNTATKVINVEQAELKTAKVEITHITVNARKLTLSVFRQIQEEDIIVGSDGEYSLAGVPWGLVNYFWGDMDTQGLHVLWQKGKELRRALVYSRAWKLVAHTVDVESNIIDDDGDRWRDSIFFGPSRAKKIVVTRVGYSVPSFRLPAKWRNPYIGYEITGSRGVKAEEHEFPVNAEHPGEDQERHAAYIDEVKRQAKRAEEVVRAAFKPVADRIAEEETANRAAFNAQVDALAALPQLFVAV